MVPENFFQDFYTMNYFKGLSIIYCFSVCLILFPLFGGIIWFEKYGSDHKRTLINMIVSLICWTAIRGMVTVPVLDATWLLLGPLPRPVCFVQAVLRSAVTCEFLLYYDAVVAIRFVYIFVLKNPAAFCDEFWIRFISIAIKSFGLIFQSAWHLTAKRQPIVFYICCGIDPSSDDKELFKAYGVLEVLSFLLHIVIPFRIWTFKRSQKVGPETLNYFRKGLFLADIDSRTLSTNAVSLANILLLCVTSFNIIMMNRIDPKSLNEQPFDYFGYFALLISPPTLSLCAVVLFYRSNKELTEAMRQLASEFFRIFYKAREMRLRQNPNLVQPSPAALITVTN